MKQALFLLSALSLVSGGFIDMDTPLDKRTTTSLIDGTIYNLVMSDEFNVPNRTFTDGHDPVWTALDKSDDDSSSAGGGSQQFYNSSYVTTTEDGFLKISSVIGKTEWNRFDHVNKEWKHETSNFLSGMMQSWEKFCFTGGIVEIDIILPGDPYIGGLWPAVWILGNLGRATYEASTNNIWPWSYDTCNRTLQNAQTISACNRQNHYGLNPFQGRGATEIDLIEVMTGDNSDGPLPGTEPPVELPYCDFTLQVAPGVKSNRPQSGAAPIREDTINANGRTEFTKQTWYDGLVFHGNTSINPFFYGTYLAETKPNEPVTRDKTQAFQADAIGAMHQLTPAHFKRLHTFRVEWQPGAGGRLDWFTKSHRVNAELSMEGDGKGTDWVHAFSLKEKSLKDLMGSQIPNEPSHLIMNTAISSTWGFPYSVPAWCTRCFDCEDPKCSCNFAPGFCAMMSEGVAMYIDHIRVFQSNNDSAHVGNPHTLGCDPPAYPTREWIKGHEYRYMRNPPFSYADKGPLKRRIQRGGGTCEADIECGGNINNTNLTKVFLGEQDEAHIGRGQCVERQEFMAMFTARNSPATKLCKCNEGFTGPHCLAQLHVDHAPSAMELRTRDSPFHSMQYFQVTPFMMGSVLLLVPFLLAVLVGQVYTTKEVRASSPIDSPKQNRLIAQMPTSEDTVITGRSV